MYLMGIPMQAYLTPGPDDLLDLRGESLDGMAGDEPGHLVGYAQLLEQPQEPQRSNFAGENALRVVGHVVVGMLARAEVGGDGVEVDGQSDADAVFPLVLDFPTKLHVSKRVFRS